MLFNRRTFLSLLLFCTLFSCTHREVSPPCEHEQIVGAFDIGSGTTKLMVARGCVGTGEVLQVLYEESAPVAYAEDLARSGQSQFSSEIIHQGELVLERLIVKAREKGAQSLVGVATQAFRKARNAQSVLRHWSLRFQADFQLITQDREAELALLLVEQLTGHNGPLLVWDIGGGSQQWIARLNQDLKILKGTNASVSFRDGLHRLLERPVDQRSVNPLSPPELEVALSFARSQARGEFGEGLDELLQSHSRIVGIGGVHGASLRHQLGLKNEGLIKRHHLERVLLERASLREDQISSPYSATEITNLILVLGFMQEYSIDSYELRSANLTQSLISFALRQ
jgi:exopolyphosphatase / guanosine-5'-triphosphate,3'-diphosphate pyrophosphatase